MTKQDNPIKATALMVSLNFVKPALGVFLIPLYLQCLTTAEYGLYTLMVAVSGIFNIFGTLRINSAMVPFYFDYNHDQNLLYKYLGQLFSFSLVVGSITYVLALVLGPTMFGFIFNDPSVIFYPFGAIVIASGILNAINSVYYIFLKNSKQFGKLSIIILCQIALSILIQVYLILYAGAGVVGLLYGVMIPYILTLFYILYTLRKLITWKPDWTMILPSLKYSLALIPFLVVYWLNSKGDRIVLEQYLSLDDVGRYALLMVVCGIMLLVADAVINGIRPFLYEHFQNGIEKHKSEINLMVKFFISINILTIGGILLIGGNLNLLTSNEEFLSVMPYFTIAAIFMFSRSYLLLFNAQLNYTKSSKTISFFSVISLVFLLILYHFFAKEYGIIGVIYAGIVVGICTSMAFYFAAQNKMKVPYNLFDIFVVPIMTFISIFAIKEYLPYSLSVKSAIQFLCSMIAVGIIFRGDFNQILDYLKKELKVK